MDRFSTQRTNLTTRSASRPRKRGLSLTSKSQASSLQKQINTHFVSIGQKQYPIHPQITHRPILQFSRPQYNKFDHHERIGVQNNIFVQNNKKNNQKHFQGSYAIKRQSIKPKVTFNYSNTIPQTHYRQNYFVSAVKPSVLQYQKRYSNNFIPIENKSNNLNPPNIIPINYVLNHNPIVQKQSDRYPHISNYQFERQPINKQSLYEVQLRVQNQISLLSKPKEKQFLIQDTKRQFQSLNTSQIYPSVLQQRQQQTFEDYIHPQELNKNRLEQQQYRSPYHMLISTAKKCQSKQVSPSKLRENENKISQLGIMSLQQIPQVNQFTIKVTNTNQTIDYIQQQNINAECPQSVEIQTKNILKVKNTNFTPQQSKVSGIESLQKSIPYAPTKRVIKCSSINKIIQQQKVHQLSSQKKSSSNIKTKQQIKEILRNKKTTKSSLFNQKDKNKLKKSSNKISLNSIQQIQNKKPVNNRTSQQKNYKLRRLKTNQKNITTNSKRNSRRIKQIQRRLEQIITICDKNL